MRKDSRVAWLVAVNACLLAVAFLVLTPSVSYAGDRDCGTPASGDAVCCVGGLDHDTNGVEVFCQPQDLGGCDVAGILCDLWVIEPEE